LSLLKLKAIWIYFSVLPLIDQNFNVFTFIIVTNNVDVKYVAIAVAAVAVAVAVAVAIDIDIAIAALFQLLLYFSCCGQINIGRYSKFYN
jgi:hypothetical protein